MRSSCVSPKDFKATAPESKQHPTSCTRANSQWREKRSSEKIRKRDLSLLVVGNVLANDSDSMQTYTSATNELFRLSRKYWVSRLVLRQLCTRALTYFSLFVFLSFFFVHSKRSPRVSSARFVTTRDLFSRRTRSSVRDIQIYESIECIYNIYIYIFYTHVYIYVYTIHMYLRTYGQLRVDRRNHVSSRIRLIGRA